MRVLVRPELPFPKLKAETDTLVDEFADQDPYEPSWRDHLWRSARVLGTLRTMHGNSCAYCQGPLTHSDRGDVEHFRPKSKYWWLAYVFENYLLSCARCNRVLKKAKFPLAPGKSRLQFGDGREPSDEGSLLIDPCVDPVDALGIQLRGGRLWFLKAKSTAGQTDPKAQKTLEFFQLNQGVLVGDRQRAISDALEEAQDIRDGRGKRSKLKKMASRYQPWGSWVRRILKKGFEDLLPTATEELQLLTTDLRLDLETYEISLIDDPANKNTRRLRDETLWALAVIRHSPPFGIDPAEVDGWLPDSHKPEIQERLDLLNA